MFECFCINITNISASKKIKQFLIAIMLLDLLVLEVQCSIFVIALRVAHTNNPRYRYMYTKNITQYFIQLTLL